MERLGCHRRYSKRLGCGTDPYRAPLGRGVARRGGKCWRGTPQRRLHRSDRSRSGRFGWCSRSRRLRGTSERLLEGRTANNTQKEVEHARTTQSCTTDVATRRAPTLRQTQKMDRDEIEGLTGDSGCPHNVGWHRWEMKWTTKQVVGLLAGPVSPGS